MQKITLSEIQILNILKEKRVQINGKWYKFTPKAITKLRKLIKQRDERTN